MKKTIIIMVITTFILLQTITVAGLSDYRPQYFFSKDVFENLPEFPEDFYEIKHLFETQQITAEQLGEEYYMQPEILPSWEYCSEQFYNKSTNNIGRYGIGFFPSRFDVYSFKPGQPIKFSSIAYAAPGIQIYQGLKLLNSSSMDYNVTFIDPGHILLSPTYPVFKENWSQIVIFEVIPNEEKEMVVDIYEKLPDQEYEEKWINITDGKYVSGNSLLSLKTPRLQIYFHAESFEEANMTEAEKNASDLNPIYLFLYIIFMLIAILYLGNRYVKRRKQQQKN